MSPELFITIRYFKSKKRNIFISLLTIISILGVLIAVTALIVVNSVVGGFEKEITEKVIDNEPHILIYSKGEAIEDKEYYSIINKLKKIDDIMIVTPFVSSTVLISSDDNLNAVKLTGIEPKLAKESYGIFRKLLRGKLSYMQNPNQSYIDYKAKMNSYMIKTRKKDLENAKTEEDKNDLKSELEYLETTKIVPPKNKLECLYIGKSLADSLRIGVGSSLKLITPFGDIGPTGLMPKTKRFRICGIFFTSLYDFDLTSIYTSIKTAKKFLGISEITGIEIKVKNIYKMNDVMAEVKKNIDNERFKVSGFSKMNKNLFSALKLEKKGMFLLLFLILLVSSFNIIATLTLIVNSRKHEISILRALGFTKSKIRKIYIYRGAIIGLVGVILGTIIGFGILYGIENLYTMNQEIYYIEKLPIKKDLVEIISIIIITFFITLFASVIPASKAAAITPVYGLKGK
jgi:lipoprotein-releasing system permease protein